MSNAAIRRAIETLAGVKGEDKVAMVAAEVISVDEAARTCNVEVITGIGQTEIENVQLMASIDDGLLLIPAIGSTIIVSYSAFNQPFVSLFSELSKVLLVAGENNASIQIDESGVLLEIAETKLLISDGLTKFNEGDLGGLVKVIDLTNKLNALENKVNSIISAFNSHTHILTLSTGTGTAAPTSSPVSGTLTPTNRADIENDKITM
jgi:hypothetical protein